MTDGATICRSHLASCWRFVRGQASKDRDSDPEPEGSPSKGWACPGLRDTAGRQSAGGFRMAVLSTTLLRPGFAPEATDQSKSLLQNLSPQSSDRRQHSMDA